RSGRGASTRTPPAAPSPSRPTSLPVSATTGRCPSARPADGLQAIAHGAVVEPPIFAFLVAPALLPILRGRAEVDGQRRPGLGRCLSIDLVLKLGIPRDVDAGQIVVADARLQPDRHLLPRRARGGRARRR